jgi:outer membrane receptor protein involved in Fe transport
MQAGGLPSDIWRRTRRWWALRSTRLGILGVGVCCAPRVVSAEPSAAPAREEPASAPLALEHDVVVRGASPDERARQRAFQASLPATVVSGEEVRASSPSSLADGLRTAAPSVSIQQTTPGQGTIQVRGMSGRAVVYAVDGVRLNMAFFRAGNNDYLGLLDPYAASSVTVVPGAASVEYGSDALGGAVLVNTETPAFRLGESRSRYHVSQSFSSNPRSTATRVVAFHEREAVAASLGFTYYQGGAIRPGAGLRSPDPGSYVGLERAPGETYTPRLSGRQLGTEFEFYAADATLRKRILAGVEVVLKGQYSLRPELLRYDQIVPRFKQELPARAERSLSPMSRAMTSITLRKRQRGGAFEHAELQLAWQRIAERRIERRLDEVCVEPGTAALSDVDSCSGRLRLVARPERSFEENSSDAFTLRAEGRKATASGAVSVILGGDLHHDIVNSAARRVDLHNQVPSARGTRYPDGSTVSEAALFTHLRVRVAPRLQLFGGARSAAFFLNLRQRGGDEPSPGFRRTVADVVGSVGVRYELTRDLAWVVNGARGVRAPNLEDLAALGSRTGGRYQVPNPGLRPEHSYTADTGFKFERPRSRAQANLFFTYYGDAIALAATQVAGQSQTPEGDSYYHSVNASAVVLYGAEGAYEVELAPRVSTFARVLVMTGTQYNSPATGLPEQTPADRVPPAQGELGVTVQVLDSLRLRGFALGRAAQRRLNDPVNLEDNRIPRWGTPAYSTYHVRVELQASRQLSARLSFDNITNELALDHGSGFYRPGFAMTASATLELD